MKKRLAICLLALGSLTAVSVSAFTGEVNQQNNIEYAQYSQVPCDTIPCNPCDTTCYPVPCNPAPCNPAPCNPGC